MKLFFSNTFSHTTVAPKTLPREQDKSSKEGAISKLPRLDTDEGFNLKSDCFNLKSDRLNLKSNGEDIANTGVMVTDSDRIIINKHTNTSYISGSSDSSSSGVDVIRASNSNKVVQHTKTASGPTKTKSAKRSLVEKSQPTLAMFASFRPS